MHSNQRKPRSLAAAAALLLFGGLMPGPSGAAAPGDLTAATPRATAIKDMVVGNIFVRFSPDGRELARIPMFGPVLLSDTAGYKKGRTFDVGMRMVAYSPDGAWLATAEGTDGARIWDATAQGRLLVRNPTEVYLLEKPLQVLEVPGRKVVHWTEFSPDGKRLIAAYSDGHVKVWNTSSWEMEEDLALSESPAIVAAFAPDGKSLVVGDQQGSLHHWNFESRKKIESALTREPLGPVVGVAFAPDGKTLATTHVSSSSRMVRIWNTSTWIAQVHEGYRAAAFSRDGQVLALGWSHIKLLDCASGMVIRTIEIPELSMSESGPAFAGEMGNARDRKVPIQIMALAFSPDGRTMAAGCMATPLRIVDLFAPEPLIKAGAEWRYWDKGGLPDGTWKEAEFDDSSWNKGAARLGYGGDGERTTVGFGPDEKNKNMTTYFRRAFEVADAASIRRLSILLARDDGAVVYLNGREILRSNMPEGAIDHSTPATGAVGNEDEKHFFETSVEARGLRSGRNVLSVEVHQASAASSDLGFDLELIPETSSLQAGEPQGAKPQAAAALQSPKGIPEELAGEWASGDAKFDRDNLIAGTAAYFNTNGFAALFGAPPPLGVSGTAIYDPKESTLTLNLSDKGTPPETVKVTMIYDAKKKTLTTVATDDVLTASFTRRQKKIPDWVLEETK